MTITMNGRKYVFRECDVKGRALEEVQKLAEKTGHFQYEPHAVWLVVPGVGYGMEYWEITC